MISDDKQSNKLKKYGKALNIVVLFFFVNCIVNIVIDLKDDESNIYFYIYQCAIVNPFLIVCYYLVFRNLKIYHRKLIEKYDINFS